MDQESHQLLAKEIRKYRERKGDSNRDTRYSSGSFHLLEHDMPFLGIEGIYLRGKKVSIYNKVKKIKC